MPILVDTSVIIAVADRTSPRHRASRRAIESTREVLVVPPTVLPEVDFLLTKMMGGHVALAALKAVRDGALRLEQLTLADVSRALEIMERYADSEVGFVDSTIVAVAERLKVTKVLTLDRRHFGMFRPSHCAAFELLPESRE
jgi:hypothetical protein